MALRANSGLFGPILSRILIGFFAASIASCFCILIGCSSNSRQSEQDRLADEGKGLFKQGAKADGSAGAATDSGAWSVLIVAYRGDGSVESAKRALERVQTLGGMPGAYIERRGDVTAVCHGKYPSPQDPKAQADLKNIREMEFGGERPFAGAVLAPPVGPPPQGGTPEYNLAGVKKLEGPEALYTLQIGFYGREDRKAPASSELAEFRKAAEEAVALLRREGERAYYYHGPNGSMVTVGVFGKDAVDAVTLRYVDPTLKQLQERYPYNLVNGKAVREVVGRKKSDGQKAERLQPSTLVAIPD